MSQKGFIQLPLLGWGAVAAGAVILALSGAVWVQTARLDSVRTEYQMFAAGVMAVGEVAKKEKAKQERADKRNKEQTDADHKRTTAGLIAHINVLRDERARGGGLSSASTPTAGSNRTCFDPALLAGALRRLDQGSLDIAGAGQAALINLDAAKKWAANRSTE